MPWKSEADHRAYQLSYQKSPEQVRRRVARNRARREAIRKYGKAALKGKDIGHRVPLDKGGSTALSNTFVQSRKSNRGFSRDARNQPR